MINIVTDSTCDIERGMWKKLGITVVPLTVNFGGRVYKDGYDLGHREFYEKLENASVLPKTSQVNSGEFELVFEDAVKDGGEVVGIFISSELSGTLQSAQIAANEVCPERIFIVDSRVASFQLGILVMEAVKMRDSGAYTASEIAQTIQKLALRMRIFAVVDTLKYLKMGGRISQGAAVIGGMLGITPLMQVYEGKIEAIGKVRGERAGFQALLAQMKKYPPDFRYPVGFGHSNDQAKMERAIEFFKDYTGDAPVYKSWIGSVIGTHTGPGVIAVGYVMKE